MFPTAGAAAAAAAAVTVSTDPAPSLVAAAAAAAVAAKFEVLKEMKAIRGKGHGPSLLGPLR